ncbi:transposase [Arthrobacter sp. CAU 1506]|uniref:IS110 family transposase n=1 Tax=Arthrobacter sp. CAU 1506 TaxID=2560052 RepID=UPI0023EF4CED|nr:transposase [Arthrobacter sp. CAU 1506]
MIKDNHLVDVFIGVDVGKSNHHAVALDRNGKKLLDKALPQDEAQLREIIASLARHGTLLLVVDQPATIAHDPTFTLVTTGGAILSLEELRSGLSGAGGS